MAMTKRREQKKVNQKQGKNSTHDSAIDDLHEIELVSETRWLRRREAILIIFKSGWALYEEHTPSPRGLPLLVIIFLYHFLQKHI